MAAKKKPAKKKSSEKKDLFVSITPDGTLRLTIKPHAFFSRVAGARRVGSFPPSVTAQDIEAWKNSASFDGLRMAIEDAGVESELADEQMPALQAHFAGFIAALQAHKVPAVSRSAPKLHVIVKSMGPTADGKDRLFSGEMQDGRTTVPLGTLGAESHAEARRKFLVVARRWLP